MLYPACIWRHRVVRKQLVAGKLEGWPPYPPVAGVSAARRRRWRRRPAAAAAPMRRDAQTQSSAILVEHQWSTSNCVRPDVIRQVSQTSGDEVQCLRRRERETQQTTGKTTQARCGLYRHRHADGAQPQRKCGALGKSTVSPTPLPSGTAFVPPPGCQASASGPVQASCSVTGAGALRPQPPESLSLNQLSSQSFPTQLLMGTLYKQGFFYFSGCRQS